MQDQLKSIREHVAEELKNIQDTGALEQLRVRVLGKKGELTAILRGMGKLPAEERPKMGQIVNETREKLEAAIDQAAAALRAKEKELRLRRETIDVTMPGRTRTAGSLHPMNIVLDDLLDGTVLLTRTEFIAMVSSAGGKKSSGFQTCFSVQCNNSALVAKNKELPAVVEIVDKTTGRKVKVPTTREIVDKKTGETKTTRRGCPRWTDCIVMQTSYVDARAEAVELGLAMGEMLSFRTWLEDNGRA